MCQIFEDLAEKRANERSEEVRMEVREETRIETLFNSIRSYGIHEVDSRAGADSYERIRK